MIVSDIFPRFKMTSVCHVQGQTIRYYYLVFNINIFIQVEGLCHQCDVDQDYVDVTCVVFPICVPDAVVYFQGQIINTDCKLSRLIKVNKVCCAAVDWDVFPTFVHDCTSPRLGADNYN